MRSYVAKEKGPSGLADIKVLPKTIKISFVEPDEAGRPRVFELDRANGPVDARNGRFNVAMSTDKTRLYDLLPTGGKDITYLGTFVELSHPQDQFPAPINDDGRQYDFIDPRSGRPVHRVEPQSRIFTMRFKILSGDYKDLIVPLRLRYLFAEDLDTGEAMVYSATAGYPWQDWARQLLIALRTAGMDMAADILPYTPDGSATLVALDRILKSKREVVTLHIGKTGWCNRISPGPTGVTIETFDDTPKKSKRQEAKEDGETGSS